MKAQAPWELGGHPVSKEHCRGARQFRVGRRLASGWSWTPKARGSNGVFVLESSTAQFKGSLNQTLPPAPPPVLLWYHFPAPAPFPQPGIFRCCASIFSSCCEVQSVLAVHLAGSRT